MSEMRSVDNLLRGIDDAEYVRLLEMISVGNLFRSIDDANHITLYLY